MNLDLAPFFETMKIKDVKQMTLDEFMTLQNLIEGILKEIEDIDPVTQHFTKKEIGEIKLLASEFKRVRKQRDNLRSVLLDKGTPNAEDMGQLRLSEEEFGMPKKAMLEKQKKRTM